MTELLPETLVYWLQDWLPLLMAGSLAVLLFSGYPVALVLSLVGLAFAGVEAPRLRSLAKDDQRRSVVQTWDLAAQREVPATRQVVSEQEPVGLDVSPDRRWLLVTDEAGGVRVLPAD